MHRSLVTRQEPALPPTAARRIATCLVAAALLALLAVMLARTQKLPAGGPLLTEDLSWLFFAEG